MKIFRDLDKIPEQYKGAVITLGNFDGLHLGHRAIIEQAKAIAAKNKAPLALMTFEPHPREFFSSASPSPFGRGRGEGSFLPNDSSPHPNHLPKGEGTRLRIYSLRSKLAIIKDLGIECVFLMRFNTQFADLSADDFIKKILIKELRARHLITGENFYFGKNRGGNKDILASTAKEFGFEYTACAHTNDGDGQTISSSLIRSLLKNGEIKKAGQLLGGNYHISGLVKHGEGRGRELGFPTANITLDKLALPKLGIYAVKAVVGKKEYKAVASIGTKPTFGKYAPLLEVHLFDTNENLYGKRMCVEFIEFIRGEEKFTSVDELKKAMAKDCDKAKTILTVIPA